MMPPARISGIARLVAGLAVGGLTGLVLAGTLRRAEPLGVVVITLDTTRADRLSPYGFANISLPSVERLAQEGVVFDRATSVAPLTLPAHTSLFTGLLPPNHGVRDNADPALADSHTTLAEVFRARGFRTAAFVGSVVLDPERGLKQGFEHYDGIDIRDPQSERRRNTDEVITNAIQWLGTIDGSRFFLWVHLYDPHRPYEPPEPYATIYAHDPYLGEIAFADAQAGRLLERMERLTLLNRTIVVIAGDHGESLGQHGERDHGILIYENVLRVPLIVRAPAVAAGRVGEVVRLIDVMPTILELLDIDGPSMDGISLVDVMRGRRRALNLEVYSESLYPARLGWSPLRALRQGRFKLIDAPRPELYDLEHDPFEEENIYAEHRALAEAMTRRLSALAMSRATTPPSEDSLTPAVRARFHSLGYVASSVTREAARDVRRPDPKDCLGTFAMGGRSVPPGRGCQ